MKIAFFTLSYKSTMYNSLIMEFVRMGHEVVVITPIYHGKSKIVEEDGLRVLYFNSFPMINIDLIRKGIANIVFPFKCLFGIKQFIKSEIFDLILMTTPPLGFYKPINYLIKKNKNAIFYLILRDIHPEGAKFIGLDKIKPVYNFFRRIEKNLYKKANYIGCMSPRNISFIAERNGYINDIKLKMLPNWGTIIHYEQPKKDIKFNYNLDGKFIVLYGGNMGIPQNLDILLRLAERKSFLSDVVFVLIGRGTEKNKLEKQAQSMNLRNIRFMEYIPHDDYFEIMKICDVGFISLHPNAPIPCIPSKTLSYFGAKLPILASIDPLTDYGEYMLENSNSGYWSLATDFEGLSANFDRLYYNADLRKSMGENGYNYLLNNFSTRKAYQEIVSVCN